MRIGEACTTEPSAVDLEAATPTVDATVIPIRGLGRSIQNFPKSTAGRRTLVLPPAVVDLLRRRITVHPRPDADPSIILSSPQGRLRDPSNTSGDLRAALERRLPVGHSHVFRKTVATRLDDGGLSARQMPTTSAHSRPSLTQDLYLGRRLRAGQGISSGWRPLDPARGKASSAVPSASVVRCAERRSDPNRRTSQCPRRPASRPTWAREAGGSSRTLVVLRTFHPLSSRSRAPSPRLCSPDWT